MGKRVMETRKQAVSIRMSSADVRKIKRLAERLGVRDSDIIRFAVKSMLGKLAPLHDPTIRGRGLVPVFLDSDQELFHHFDLDATRLENIVNEGVEPESRVSREDVQLIALSGARGNAYLRWSLGGPATAVNGHRVDAGGEQRKEANGSHHPAIAKEPRAEAEGDRAAVSIRSYLFQKYVYGDSEVR
jgi:hypothetical protein